MTLVPRLLTILFAFTAIDRARTVCILSFPEASVGEVFIGGNLTSILKSECTGQISLTETNPANPYFKLENKSITVISSTRYESENDTLVGQGNGRCSGQNIKRTIPDLNFQCSNAEPAISCTIDIQRVDNFPPFFCNENCKRIDTNIAVNLLETQPVGQDHIFYRGKRCDEDSDVSSSDSYDIIDTNGLFKMSFQTSTFNLWLLQKLDYEKVQDYSVEMVITSIKWGNISKTVNIHVEDADDQSPIFTENIYTCNITEGHYKQTNGLPCQVNAYDPDVGINATLKYKMMSFVPNNGNVLLSISENDGTMHVDGVLDRETVAEYALSVMAYQEDRPSDRFNLSTVIVYVEDVDDNPPEFDADTVTVEIMENTNNDVVIYTPTVTDKDQGENAKYRFSLNDRSVFKTNQTTGEIMVKDSSLLDRESHPNPYIIQITASSASKTAFKDTMILNVSLLDVNDNSPLFTNSSYYLYTIQRNFAVGKEIFRVTANDADSDQNGQITYSLTSKMIPFDIDSTTGAIKLNKPLRDTTIHHYDFDVKAVDNPSESSMTRSSWAKVHIEITDVNTHKPSFNIVWKNNNITENGDDNIIVAILKCTDLDWSDTLNVSISGGSEGKFSVSKMEENLYKLKTTKPLDREERSNYVINMSCSDGSHKQVLTVPVKVLDQNDNPPQFKATLSVELNVTENQSKQFTQFVATDLDSGKNREVVYSIVPNAGLRDNITIDPRSGKLTIHALDRESLTSDTIDVIIVAADQGSPSLTSTLNIKVTVLDVNDNPPVFTHYNGKHDVFVKEGKILTDNTCVAYDADKGQNKKIIYGCRPNFNSMVTVDDSGKVTFNLTRFDLDKGNRPAVFTVNIVAYNPTPYSNSQKNATCVMALHVVDVNDNSPTFTLPHYNFPVNEIAPVGSYINSVTATDEDRSPEYSIVKYTMDKSTDLFRVDRLSGKIFLNKEVDYDTEGIHNYTFKVCATDADDQDTEPMNVIGTTTVIITVTPENDNAPKFLEDFTFCQLDENFTGDFNCSVMASDADGDSVTYNMESQEKSFEIYPNGTLRCKTGLDFETSKDHIMFLNVSATDTKFIRYTTVVVELIDINDERPKFSKDNYTFELYENNLKNQLVGVFEVTDADSTSINYTLDTNKDFEITSTGELQAKNSFDREMTELYSLLVTAFDGVNKVSVPATVKILDRNDNEPNFARSSETIQIQENAAETTRSFTAQDVDTEKNGQVSYSLVIADVWQDNITINNSGKITIKSLDREALDSDTLDFIIMAVDNGAPSLTGTLNVKVTVSDVNDNAPVFTRCFDEQTLFLTEGEVYKNLLELQASDKDEGKNSEVRFALQQAPSNLESAIEVSNNGSVNFDLTNVDVDMPTTTKVDWEVTVETYNPTAYTNGMKNNTCVIKLHVLDKNDNLPKFNKLKYSFNLKETAETGTSIGSVTATDNDRSPEYSLVKYTMDNSTDLFRIDRLTGEIFLNKEVDYDTEKKLSYTFKVYVTDADDQVTGPINVNGTTTVIITVTPENDNAPKFMEDFTICQLQENQMGNFNCSVMASDADGDHVTYNMESQGKSFVIYPNGTLRCKTGLDFETSKDHIMFLNISATDKKFTRYATVVVELMDVNDEKPRFSKDNYTFELYENNMKNQLVGVFEVTDADSTSINYTLDANNDFQITSTGELQAKNSFDREMKELYNLLVTAFDGVNNVSVPTTVKILDRNDNEPKFTRSSETIQIQENAAETTRSFIQAQDADTGENGQVSYSLVIPDVWQNNITINNSGKITIKSLDREALDSDTLDFIIVAVDNGAPSLTGTLNVKVTVSDVNDNAPVFTRCFDEQTLFLTEGEVYKDLLELQASDKDEGKNSEVRFAVQQAPSNLESAVEVSSNGSVNFDLTNVDVDVPPTTKVDWEVTVETYNPTAYIPEMKNNTCVIKLHVLDKNDNSPKFNQTKYSFDLKETAETGTFIGSVTATDNDRSPEYSIVKYTVDNHTDLFRIDRLTGEIFLNKEVDFDTEKIHSYTFKRIMENQINIMEKSWKYHGILLKKVYAADVDTNLTAGTGFDKTEVTIVIKAENDNAPQFEQDFIKCSLPENYAGPMNCTIVATDKDKDKITYTIEPANLNFTIMEKGILYSNTRYDYETGPDEFFLNITAYDRLHYKSTIVEIVLLNINDEVPQFSNNSYMFELYENNLDNQLIGTLHVTDLDSQNIIFTVSNTQDFWINSEGELHAKHLLDREMHDSYRLKVTASDGTNENHTFVHVTILDTNDNVPKFNVTGKQKELTIPENSVQTFGPFEAFDPDDGDNGNVSYSLMIHAQWQENITLDHSGKLTIKSLDREALDGDTLDLTIMAMDHGSPALTGTLNVKVIVSDENDNPPVFTKCFDEPNVFLNEGGVYTNFSCKAVDKDDGNNGVIRYKIADLKHFPCSIDPSSGDITFNLTDVDADNGADTWSVTLEAYNPFNATNVGIARRNFVLHVLDVNDNSPVFNKSRYDLNVSEDTDPGSRIGRVLATDKDRSTEFNTVEYMMDNSPLFRVDRVTGVIYLVMEIDYDTQNHSYSFQITATDGYNNVTAEVTITVSGVNDIAPQFTQEFSMCDLREGVTGEFNCHVKAEDLDVGESSALKYAVETKDADFSIDEDGNLTSNTMFNYEDNSLNHTFFLNVSVTDSKYKVFTTVVVVLININDEVPVFSQLNYTFYIDENNPKGTVVGSIHVFDADSENISLTIDNTADFEITTEGDLLASREFDAEKTTEFTLTVTAYDGFNPVSAPITVFIQDLNDNAPEIDSSVFQAELKINESQLVGYVVVKIAAVDQDRDAQNNQVEYILLDGNINNTFILNSTRGELSLYSVLNASLIRQYDLVIQARDSGTPSLSNITTVTVNIIDENNNPPYFVYEPYVGSVKENTNDVILRVHAADPDLDSKLTFTVMNDKMGWCNLSFVDDVLYADDLDTEATMNGTIICDIQVKDGIQSASTTVVVHVVDVNDNPPVFDDTASYMIEVDDTLPIRSPIMTISATDADLSTQHESILYFLHEESVDVNYFGIDYLTGEITVQQSLGPVSGDTVNVSVTARDAGLPPQNTTRIVTIHVKEVNIHSPVFDKAPIIVRVKENSHVFSEVINASDADGDTLSYRIIPGYDADLFEMDESSGLLGLLDKSFMFDYETKSEYKFVIQATDDARFPKSANVTVIVKVIDVNEAPKIEVPNFLIYEKINTTAGDIITTVKIKDPDTKNETFREYNISVRSISLPSRTKVSFFSVSKNGTIFVNSTLTQNGTFVLAVQVTNLDKHSYSQPIKVIVSNVEGTTKRFDIFENNLVPYTLCSLDGNFNYSIASSTTGNFSVIQNGKHSDLITNTVFDYDKMDIKTIDFSIEGVNKQTSILEKQIQVHVEIHNLNDNSPEFNSTHYEIRMYENQTAGDIIGKVTATDRDGTLTNLTYSIDGTKRFSIEQVSGTISVTETWNFENSTVHAFEFNVTCNDTEFTNYTTVKILLIDMNDNPPVFTQTRYNFSVFEDLPIGVKVPNVTVFASDVDTMDQGKLTYQILPDKNGSYFDIDIDSSGNFSSFVLAKALDYEQMKSLVFDVMVFDTAQQNSTATVTVVILDVNDNAPVFNETSYKFTVKEGKVYNDSNFEISAYDLDSGENGQVDLTLKKPYPVELHLSTDTGILDIWHPLDREDSNVRHENGTAIYEVTVLATDNGDPHLSSSILVSICVEDVNDCPPVFSQLNYSISIQEGVSIGQQVTTFTTSDCDYNPEFTQSNFTLTGDGSESFRLENAGEHTAKLFVEKELDWHVKQYYTLIVTAFDGKNTENASVLITVLDTNDNAPHFNETEYRFNVSENQKSGVMVGTVSATDEDVGLNGNVTYSITSGNVNQSFTITTDFNDAIGKIQTTTSLDRERQSMYVMIITAEDMAKRDSRQGTCTVTVYVDDINDNSPVFNTKYGYRGTVRENAPNNTKIQVVPSIAATDMDFGTNGTTGIRFSIPKQKDSKIFTINETTGEVFVAGDIDREKTSKFHFMILAEDSNGGPGARNSTAALTITVMDENDSPPVFVNGPYVFNVLENSPSSTSVGRVTVSDADVNGTEHVRFRIIHGDGEKFYIKTNKASGIIHVMGDLDRETKDMYNLTVTADDGANESNTTVTINILDMNDEAPVFVDATLTVEVTENMPVGTFVCNVTAVDGDQINTDNSKVKYSLNNTSEFSIADDGRISTSQAFDRESQSRYEIEVIAVDSGTPQLNSTMIITVLISDINDNSPHFLDENGRNITQKEVNIVEKCPVDTVVALVVAQDNDIGENSEIVFSIEPEYAREYFKLDQIDETTAVVRVAKAVVINTLINSGIAQRTVNTSDSVVLDLMINARDNATVDKRRNNSMDLRIVVEPINDAMPVFLKPDRPLKIWENVPVGSVVGQCQAVVKNASYTHLRYSLLDNRTKTDFFLNPENCTITTKVNMDRETVDMYNFPVMVKDGRTPERTAYTQIEIIVMDINDNIPKFYEPVIKLDLVENTDYLQPINVSAVDADKGENAILYYTLLDDFDGLFWIQQNTGILNITQPLNYEEHTNITLNIVSTDHGQPSLSSTATVYITVIDINDNAPQFYNVNTTISVQENYVGKVYQVYANDSDSGLNGEVFYSLKSSPRDIFTIDPFDGSLFVKKGLDYEMMSKYILEVTATDHGDPPQSTTINITVNVEDVYDFVPTFNKEVYECSVSRSAQVRHVIIDLNVTHGNENVNFGMKGPGADFFNINKDNGEIYVAQPLDAQRSDYILTVTAEDKAHTHTANCTVLVRVVDLLLVFPQREYQVNVMENHDQAFLVDLNTTDEINGRDVLYKIIRTEPNVTGLFGVDKVGRITCLKPLDRENVSQYILYVTAEPGHKRSKRETSKMDSNLDYSTLARLIVQVTDENDNPPTFPDTQKRQFGVPRDARAGYYVTQALQAIDLDSGGIIEYEAIGGARDMFDVQKDTGAVVVLRAIASAPKTTEFNLTVLAYDPTDSTKNDSIVIEIHVIEDNNRLKLVTSLPIEEFRRKEEELVRNMSAILGVDIQTEKIEAHKEFKNGSISVFLDRSDFYFHAINSTTGLPVSSIELERLINKSGNLLHSLFHEFTVGTIVTVVNHDNSSMGIPEIALICVAVFIFLGGLVGIVIALSALRSMNHIDGSEMKKKAPRLEDFELGTIRSQSSPRSSRRPIAAVNPAFVETEFNTSGTQSQPDNKQLSQQEHESQEVRFEFNDEPIDQNLPEAEIHEPDIVHHLARNTTSKDSGVGNTSFSSHEVLHSGSSSGSDGNSGTSSPEQNDSGSNNSNLDAEEEPKLGNGPIMTSSPKIVRFRDVQVVPESNSSKRSKQSKSQKMSDSKIGVLKFTDTVGETETDDGIDADDDSIDVDHANDDIAVPDDSNQGGGAGSGEIGVAGNERVPNVLVVEHDEITSL